MYRLISQSHAPKFDAGFSTSSSARIDDMAMRLALVFLFLYSTPILSSIEPVSGEPEAARERLMSFIED
ncbi:MULTISPECIES: hypothetical protein [unclassified Pseudomonas]|jgi:hypothetical protein|uniref:hypothetical protein n=1 Tax=unclassified Pseudomonas TaxID=196821 RepID=UPI0012E1C1F3|nr:MULTISPECIES: hypothetical protein [unclassified Pseudomonas]WPN50013.1 hypothetical protein QMK58_17215 [Pseudomonas sp. P8_241]